mgnify:CR=1 FL=1
MGFYRRSGRPLGWYRWSPAYTDLGSGTLFGSRSVSAADANTQVVTSLNGSALSAISAALSANQGSGEFVIGGSLDVAAVPEPGTFALLGAALAALALKRRKWQSSVWPVRYGARIVTVTTFEMLSPWRITISF